MSLQDGWKEVTDPNSGRLYYVNKVTQQSSWTKPLVESLEVEDDLENGWKEVKDPKSGRTYFYNKHTQERSWTKPVKVIGAVLPVVQPKQEELSHNDAVDGEVTALTILAPTVGSKSSSPPSPTSTSMSTSKQPIPIKPKEPVVGDSEGSTQNGLSVFTSEWVELFDPKSNKMYFANKNTKQRVWKLPVGVDKGTVKPYVAQGEKQAPRDATQSEPVVEMVESLTNESQSSAILTRDQLRSEIDDILKGVPSLTVVGVDGGDSMPVTKVRSSPRNEDRPIPGLTAFVNPNEDEESADEGEDVIAQRLLAQANTLLGNSKSKSPGSPGSSLREGPPSGGDDDLLNSSAIALRRQRRKVAIMAEDGKGEVTPSPSPGVVFPTNYIPKFWSAVTDLQTGGVVFVHQVTRRRLTHKPSPTEAAEEDVRAKDLLVAQASVKKDIESRGREREREFLRLAAFSKPGRQGFWGDDDDLQAVTDTMFEDLNHPTYWVVKYEPRIDCYFYENALTGRVRWLQPEETEGSLVSASLTATGGSSTQVTNVTRAASMGSSSRHHKDPSSPETQGQDFDTVSVISDATTTKTSHTRHSASPSSDRHVSKARRAAQAAVADSALVGSVVHIDLNTVVGKETLFCFGGNRSLAAQRSQITGDNAVGGWASGNTGFASTDPGPFGSGSSTALPTQGGILQTNLSFGGGMMSFGSLAGSFAGRGAGRGGMGLLDQSFGDMVEETTRATDNFFTTTETFDGIRWKEVQRDVLSPPMGDMTECLAVRIPNSDEALIMGTDAKTGGKVAFVFNSIQLLCRPRQDLAGIYVDGAAIAPAARGVVVTGGFSEADAGRRERPTGECSVCDIYSLQRHPIPSLNIPRANHTLAVIDASNAYRILWFAYVMGGFDGKTKTAAVERYVLGSDHWEVMKPMTVARSAPASCVTDRCVFVLGGRVGYTVSATCEKMHTQTDVWVRMAPMRQARCCFTASVLKNFIFAVGGWDGAQWLNSVEAYDTKLDVWRAVVNLPSPKLGYGVCLLPKLPEDLLHVPGSQVAEVEEATQQPVVPTRARGNNPPLFMPDDHTTRARADTARSSKPRVLPESRGASRRDRAATLFVGT